MEKRNNRYQETSDILPHLEVKNAKEADFLICINNIKITSSHILFLSLYVGCVCIQINVLGNKELIEGGTRVEGQIVGFLWSCFTIIG